MKEREIQILQCKIELRQQNKMAAYRVLVLYCVDSEEICSRLWKGITLLVKSSELWLYGQLNRMPENLTLDILF